MNILYTDMKQCLTCIEPSNFILIASLQERNAITAFINKVNWLSSRLISFIQLRYGQLINYAIFSMRWNAIRSRRHNKTCFHCKCLDVNGTANQFWMIQFSFVRADGLHCKREATQSKYTHIDKSNDNDLQCQKLWVVWTHNRAYCITFTTLRIQFNGKLDANNKLYIKWCDIVIRKKH